MSASKLSVIAGHLVKNLDCASNYSFKRFKIIENCYKNFCLVKLMLHVPNLCKHKDFDYTVSLFS